MTLLMSPERLPSCFSFEDPAGAAHPVVPLRAPSRRQSLSGAALRMVAAWAAASRKQSAAAW